MTSSTAQAFVERERREISLTPALGLWWAIIEEQGSTIATKGRKIRSISASGATPIEAICLLIKKLETIEPDDRKRFMQVGRKSK